MTILIASLQEAPPKVHHISSSSEKKMGATWLFRLFIVGTSALGAASFDAGSDAPGGAPGNLADAMRGAAWPALTLHTP